MNIFTSVRQVLPLTSLSLAALVLLASFGVLFPSPTSAAEVSVQTTQLLPPGGSACTQLPVTGFTPYVYDGALHAFQFSIPDSSYVAIAGTVGGVNIPFSQLLRITDASGNLRVHGDIATTPIRGSVLVSVTLLSTKGTGSPLCMSVLLTAVEGGYPQQPMAQAPTPPTPPTPAQTQTTPKTEVEEVTPAPTTTPREASAATGTATTTSVSVVASMQESITKMCLEGGALRLWVVLLLVYALIVAGIILGQSSLPAALRTQEWTATGIVVPFLLLFGFWYFVESCRTSAWIPVVATIIALAGLSAAFWERKDKSGMGSVVGSAPRSSSTTSNVINLPGAKK